LTGPIPDSFGSLQKLSYLDLSNNQLSGPFPGWIHKLGLLTLLNLGQNVFSGEIPLVIGEGQNDEGVHLTSLREFIRLLSIRKKGDSYERVKLIKRIWNQFLREHPSYFAVSRDLLWIDPRRVPWESLDLQKITEEYIKAEKNHFLTKVFQNMLINPVHVVDYLYSRPTKIEGTAYSQKRIRTA
jgi:hypothetical protein